MQGSKWELRAHKFSFEALSPVRLNFGKQGLSCAVLRTGACGANPGTSTPSHGNHRADTTINYISMTYVVRTTYVEPVQGLVESSQENETHANEAPKVHKDHAT
jgi:hypothetical protein